MKKEEFGVLIDGLTASQITHTNRSHRHLGLAWLVRLSRRLGLFLVPYPGNFPTDTFQYPAS